MFCKRSSDWFKIEKKAKGKQLAADKAEFKERKGGYLQP